MAQTSVLKAEARDRVGKGAARAVRREDKVPAVIYGDKKPPIPIILNQREMTHRLHAGGFLTHLVEIEVGGEKIRAIPKDYQLDPVRDFLIHVDFLRVGEGARLTLDVPVHFINHADSPGLKRGGVLNVVRHAVELIVPADAIPEFLDRRSRRTRYRRFRPHLGDRAAGRRDADHPRPRLHRRHHRRRCRGDRGGRGRRGACCCGRC